MTKFSLRGTYRQKREILYRIHIWEADEFRPSTSKGLDTERCPPLSSPALESLNSFLAQSATMAGQICPEMASDTLFVTFFVGSRYASKAMKDSKDSDYNLVSQNIFCQKMAR